MIIQTKTIQIQNINCGHCTQTIEEDIGEIQGVKTVTADKNTKMVTITWDEPPATWHTIAAVLVDIGFPESS
ncbi:MAG: cation transporter [Thiomargarita sp.]|nr:cation transporter [Thiomargarita sp.]